MIDIQEIEDEIKKVEAGELTYQNCTKLAVLYSVLNQNQPKKNIAEYSYGSSEFLLCVSRAPIDGVLGILDEHMEAIQLLYPKEYSAIINKIKNLN